MPEITIQAPRQGIAQSPHVGFQDVRNLDIFTTPGVAKLNAVLAKKSVAVVDAFVKWIVRDPDTPANIFALDSNGVLYKSADSGATWAEINGNAFTVTIASPGVFSATTHGLVLNDTVVFNTTGALPTGLTAGTTYHVITAGLTADAFQVSASQGGAAVNTSGTQSGTHYLRPTLGATGNGLIVKWGYVFVARNARLDVMTIAGVWTNNWQTIDSDTLWHPMIVSKNDGKIYGGAGRYVFSIEELTTFVPGTGSTFTFTAQALDLPKNYRIKCLEELGNNLIIGTWMGTNIYDFKVADIFPWDRSSPSFGQPIQMTENGVNAMINIGNQLFIMAGIEGKLYRSDGYNAVQIAQIPSAIADLTAGLYLEPYPGAIMSYKGRLFFGISGSAAIDGCGVYSLTQTSEGNILNFENAISTMNMGATITQIGALLGVTRDTYLCGWRSNTTYGIDLTDNDAFNYGTTYQGYFISPFYRTGDTLLPFQFKELEFRFAKELAANEGIKIDYRINLNDSFSNIGTFDYTTYGEILSKNIITYLPNEIKQCEQIQIKVSLTGTTTTPHFTNLTLR